MNMLNLSKLNRALPALISLVLFNSSALLSGSCGIIVGNPDDEEAALAADNTGENTRGHVNLSFELQGTNTDLSSYSVTSPGGSSAGTITLDTVRLAVGCIQLFMTEGPSSCLLAQLTGQTVIDLLTGQAGHALTAGAPLYAGDYIMVIMTLSALTEPDPVFDSGNTLLSHSLVISGTYNGQTSSGVKNVPLTISFSGAEPVSLNLFEMAVLTEGTDYLLKGELNLQNWFNFNNSQTNLFDYDMASVETINDGQEKIVIDDNASLTNRELREVILENIKAAATASFSSQP